MEAVATERAGLVPGREELAQELVTGVVPIEATKDAPKDIPTAPATTTLIKSTSSTDSARCMSTVSRK